MDMVDFKIGGYFYTATGRWKVVDIGTKVVVAFRVDNIDDPDKYDWDFQNHVVFCPFDLGGCRKDWNEN